MSSRLKSAWVLGAGGILAGLGAPGCQSSQNAASGAAAPSGANARVAAAESSVSPSGGGVESTPALDRRALDFLRRAAASDMDVVACNAMEALARFDPAGGSSFFRAALASPSPLVRFAGAAAIGDARDSSAAQAARSLLTDPSPRVRLAAAYALARSGDRDAARALAGALTAPGDEKIRADAALLIGRLGDRAAQRRLEQAAARETSSFVVVHIQGALATLGDDKMYDRLIQYTLKSDSQTRLLALQTLAEIADSRAARALTYRATDASDYLETRLLAARAAGRAGSSAGYSLALENLTKSAADEHEKMRVRSGAALALGAIGDRAALPALQKLAETDSDDRTKVAAAYAICQLSGLGRR